MNDAQQQDGAAQSRCALAGGSLPPLPEDAIVCGVRSWEWSRKPAYYTVRTRTRLLSKAPTRAEAIRQARQRLAAEAGENNRLDLTEK